MPYASSIESPVVVLIEDNSSTNAGTESATRATEEPPSANALCFCMRVCKWFWIVKCIIFLVFVACVIGIVICSITKKDTLRGIAHFLFMICTGVVAIQAALYYAYRMWDLKDTMLKVLLLEMVLLAVLSYFIHVENLTPFVQGFLLAFVLQATAFMSLQNWKEENLRISNVAFKTSQALEAEKEKIKLMEVQEGKSKEELANVKTKYENLVNDKANWEAEKKFMENYIKTQIELQEMKKEVWKEEPRKEERKMEERPKPPKPREPEPRKEERKMEVRKEKPREPPKPPKKWKPIKEQRETSGEMYYGGYGEMYYGGYPRAKMEQPETSGKMYYGGYNGVKMEQPETSFENEKFASFWEAVNPFGGHHLPNGVGHPYGQVYGGLRRRGVKDD